MKGGRSRSADIVQLSSHTIKAEIRWLGVWSEELVHHLRVNAYIYQLSHFDLGQTWEHLSACLDSDRRQGQIDLVEDSCLVRHVLRTGSMDLSLSSIPLHSSGWRKTLTC